MDSSCAYHCECTLEKLRAIECLNIREERKMLSGLLLGINLKASNGNASSFLISISIVFSDGDTRYIMNLAEDGSP